MTKYWINRISCFCGIMFLISSCSTAHNSDSSGSTYPTSTFAMNDSNSTPNLISRLSQSYFIEAKTKQLQNDYYNAIDDYLLSFQYQPTALVLNNLGEIHLAINDLAKAAEYFTRAIDFDSTYSQPYYSLIDLLANKQNYIKAVPLAKKLVELESTQDSKLKLASLYHNIDLNETIRIVNECIEQYQNYELYLYLSDIYKFLKKDDKAAESEEKYFLAPVKMPGVMDNLTEMNIKNHQLLLSVKYIDTLQKYCSDDVFNNFLEDIFAFTTYREPFDFNTTYKLIKAVEKSSLDSDYRNVFLANLHLNRLDTLTATEYYRKSAHKTSELLLAGVLTNLNYSRPDEAYNIIAKNPDSLLFRSVDQFNRILQLLYLKKDLNAVIIMSKNELKNNSTYYFLLPTIADAYMGKNKLDSALVYYEKAFQYFSEDLGLRNNYAYVIAQSNGDLHKALELIDYSLKKEPNSPNFLDTHGWVNFLLGNVDIAYRNIEAALQLLPESWEGHLHLGYVLYYKGDIASALEHWEKAYQYQNHEENKLIK